MAPLTLLSNPKPNQLTYNEFCEKYGLDNKLKIIALLPGKIDKWREYCKDKNVQFKDKLVRYNYYKNNEQIHWFIQNQNKISKIFKKMGYQLVGKFHQRDFNKCDDNNKYKKILLQANIVYVEQYDSYELIKYSTYALTFGSTMVYQLYLYDLPSIEIGTGFYFPGWACNNNNDFSYMNYIKPYNLGKDLIYGHVADFKELSNNTMEYFKQLLAKEIIFKYKDNNPLYGESYGKTLDDSYKSIIKAIELMS
jgi:hypothetical protein